MGSDLESTSPSYTEIFEEVFPHYLAWGMSHDDFWNQDPKLAKYYREAHKIKLHEQNELLWLEGIYIGRALQTYVTNMFAEKRHQVTYFSEPIPLSEKERKEQEIRQQKEQEKAMKEQFMSFALNINSSLKDRK